MEDIDSPQNLSFSIYSAKLQASQNSSSLYFQEVPLKGVTSVQLVDGKGIIEGVKFDTTSYNHNVFFSSFRVASST